MTNDNETDQLRGPQVLLRPEAPERLADWQRHSGSSQSVGEGVSLRGFSVWSRALPSGESWRLTGQLALQTGQLRANTTHAGAGLRVRDASGRAIGVRLRDVGFCDVQARHETRDEQGRPVDEFLRTGTEIYGQQERALHEGTASFFDQRGRALDAKLSVEFAWDGAELSLAWTDSERYSAQDPGWTFGEPVAIELYCEDASGALYLDELVLEPGP